jgi:DNA-binding transcriptional ArsR family regulator
VVERDAPLSSEHSTKEVYLKHACKKIHRHSPRQGNSHCSPMRSIAFLMASLRDASIVATRQEGKWMHYRLAIPKDRAAASILRETLKQLREKPQMQRDISRLSSACCSPQKFDLLQGTPASAVMTASAAAVR